VTPTEQAERLAQLAAVKAVDAIGYDPEFPGIINEEIPNVKENLLLAIPLVALLELAVSAERGENCQKELRAIKNHPSMKGL
jgi:hypothetical protein